MNSRRVSNLNTDLRDIPRKEILAVAKTLPSEVGLSLIRDYDKAIIEDNTGVQWKVTAGPIKRTAKGVRADSGKLAFERQTYDDLSVRDKIDQTLTAVRNYDALIASLGKSPSQLVDSVLPQERSLARRDFDAALKESGQAASVFQQGPGQVGSHAGYFNAEMSRANALQYLWDMGVDRQTRTRTVLPQQGHILDKAKNKELAKDLSNMRGQEGEVNWWDGSGDYVNMTREENLRNGRKRAMERFAGPESLIEELQNSGASNEEVEFIVGRVMELAGLDL